MSMNGKPTCLPLLFHLINKLNHNLGIFLFFLVNNLPYFSPLSSVLCCLASTCPFFFFALLNSSSADFLKVR